MKREKQQNPQYRGLYCLRPCCTFAPAGRCGFTPALTHGAFEYKDHKDFDHLFEALRKAGMQD